MKPLKLHQASLTGDEAEVRHMLSRDSGKEKKCAMSECKLYLPARHDRLSGLWVLPKVLIRRVYLRKISVSS